MARRVSTDWYEFIGAIRSAARLDVVCGVLRSGLSETSQNVIWYLSG